LRFLDLALKHFLGNTNAWNCEELVESMLIAFENLVGRACIKIHYMFSNLDQFPDNLNNPDNLSNPGNLKSMNEGE